MNDYFLILFASVIILLTVQIVSLIRVRFLIRQLNRVLKLMGNVFKSAGHPGAFPEALQKCQFCKFRNSFISFEEEPNKFYYQCALDSHSIHLNSSCSHFKPENFNQNQAEKR